MQSFLATYVQRIQTMTETQVVDALRGMNASRASVDATLAFLSSISLMPAEDSEDEINKLRSNLSLYPRPSGNPSHLPDYLEDALKKRLKALRREGK